MNKFYIKKASKQDVERTMVLNSSAVTDFFNISTLNERDDEASVKIKYSRNDTVNDIKVVKKQDIRLFPDRTNLEENDLIMFERLDDGAFLLSYVKTNDHSYQQLVQKLNSNNYIITDNLDIDMPETSMEHNQPLNQILYGPPGTGKTYATIKKSLEILGLQTGDPAENAEIFRSQLNHRIFFATMHPSYSYEDFVQGMKPETNEAGQLIFKQKDGIFKKISKLANDIRINDGIEILNVSYSNKEILTIAFFLSKFNTKPENKANLFFGDKSYGKVYSIIGEKLEINPNTIKNYRDRFDYLASEERQGWTPKNGSTDTLDNTAQFPYNDVYNELKDKTFDEVKDMVDTIWKRTPEKQEQDNSKNQNFVLILDEINRANTSKVFGELITLIEDDKRIGGENEMSLLLSSGEEFSVPDNLYIIGTMNTADKSIALVDLALRRRFEFEAMYPDSSVIENFGKKEKYEKKAFIDAINRQLIKEKGVDFQIGHAYFLKDNTLSDVINKNILPLLVEYFRNDLKKVENFMNTIEYPIDRTLLETKGLLKYVN